MPHYYQFYEDFVTNKKRLNIERAVKQIKNPYLIIHGNKDTSIHLSEAQNLHTWNPESQLQIIENADHVFNIKHPWKNELPSKEFQVVINSILTFLNN